MIPQEDIFRILQLSQDLVRSVGEYGCIANSDRLYEGRLNMANQFEQFTPATVATNSDNLGGVRAQQYSPEAMSAMSPSNSAAAHLPEVSFGNETVSAVPKDDGSGQVSDIRRNGPPPPEMDDQPPPPTAEQIRAMHTAAAGGSLDNDTARTSVVQALQNNGVRGLTEFRDQMNTALADANSDYRARVVRADGPNGVINLYVVLQDQRNPENLADMVRDLNQNGANSQYRGRAIHLQLTPERRPDV